MQSVGNTSGALGSTSEHFVTGASGVAALDTPQLSQTKLEIRSLVAEIAEFSASQLPQADFLSAVLPRICSAMGATAAALWRCDVASHCELVGHFRLPDLLVPNANRVLEINADDEQLGEAQLNHAKILSCVAAEGTAVLVPPKSIRVASERPTNPLEECLLVVPIKIDDRHEMLLEVIQPASGGPAAQRGYLRFVAQMADLMSDYLRRERLRQYASRAAYVEKLQANLVAIGSAPEQGQRYQKIATALADLLDADLVILATRRRMLAWTAGWRVTAIGHVTSFDARSEVVITAEQLLAAQQLPIATTPQFTILATDELTNDEEEDAGQDAKPREQSRSSQRSQQLRVQLNCSHLACLALDETGDCQALISLDSSCDLSTVRLRATELARAFRAWLPSGGQSQNSTSSPSSNLQPATQRRWLSRSNLQRMVVRVSTLLLVLAVACFPTPDNIATQALLESVDKELYYSPSSAARSTASA